MEIKYKILETPTNEGMKYVLEEDYVYTSALFNRTKTLKKGMLSDGATRARDLGKFAVNTTKGLQVVISLLRKALYKILPYKWRAFLNIFVLNITDAWFVHDAFCEDPFWDDGYPVTNFVASMILCMRLKDSGYILEAYTWFFPTFFFGGEKIKKYNGWIWIKE